MSFQINVDDLIKDDARDMDSDEFIARWKYVMKFMENINRIGELKDK